MIILVLKNESVQFFNMASFEKEMSLVDQFNRGLGDDMVLNLKELGKIKVSEIKSLEHCPRIYEDSDTLPFGQTRLSLNESFEEHMELLLEVIQVECGPDGNLEMVREFIKDIRDRLGFFPFREFTAISMLRDVYEAGSDDPLIRKMFVNLYLNTRKDGSESDRPAEVCEDLQGDGSKERCVPPEGVLRETANGHPGTDSIPSESSEGGFDSDPDLHLSL